MLALAAGGTRDALESLPAPVLVIDAEGALAFANEEARHRLVGIAGEIGQPADEVLPPALREAGVADSDGHAVTVDGREFRALVRPLLRRGEPQGRILLLIPCVLMEAE